MFSVFAHFDFGIFVAYSLQIHGSHKKVWRDKARLFTSMLWISMDLLILLTG
jgi:hypothetical protein